MSRPIKFRAWDKDSKRYGEVVEIEYNESREIDGIWVWYNIHERYEPIPGANVTVEQYTGLKDKNGKEIYEGDIVENIEGINETAVCVWDESNAEFDFRCRDGKCTRDNVKSWLEMYEVIGNIHEDKELLDGSD